MKPKGRGEGEEFTNYEFAFQFGYNSGDSLGSACGCRDNVVVDGASMTIGSDVKASIWHEH
jgi:hypothetical protein